MGAGHRLDWDEEGPGSYFTGRTPGYLCCHNGVKGWKTSRTHESQSPLTLGQMRGVPALGNWVWFSQYLINFFLTRWLLGSRWLYVFTHCSVSHFEFVIIFSYFIPGNPEGRWWEGRWRAASTVQWFKHKKTWIHWVFRPLGSTIF